MIFWDAVVVKFKFFVVYWLYIGCKLVVNWLYLFSVVNFGMGPMISW